MSDHSGMLSINELIKNQGATMNENTTINENITINANSTINENTTMKAEIDDDIMINDTN